MTKFLAIMLVGKRPV